MDRLSIYLNLLSRLSTFGVHHLKSNNNILTTTLIMSDINSHIFFLTKYRNTIFSGNQVTVYLNIWFEFQLDISKRAWEKGSWQTIRHTDERTTNWFYKGSFFLKWYGTLKMLLTKGEETRSSFHSKNFHSYFSVQFNFTFIRFKIS